MADFTEKPPVADPHAELVRILMSSTPTAADAYRSTHHSNYQPRGRKGNPGQFKKGKPEYPDEDR